VIYLKISQLNEYLRMAWSAIIGHKLRSFLTTLGIFIGVTTIITIWTTIQGLNSYVNGTLADIGNSVVYVEKYPWIIKNDFWKYRNRKKVSWKEYEAIKRYSHLAAHIAPQISSRKIVSYKAKRYDNIPILGTTEQFADISSTNISDGRFMTPPDIRSRSRVVVIGAELATQLFDNASPLGQHIKIDQARYRIIGVLEKQGSFFGQSRDNFAIIPIGTFQHSFGNNRGMQIAVATDKTDDLDNLKDELNGILRKVRHVKPGAENDFAINQMDQLTSFYSSATSTLYGIIFVIAAISLLVGGIGITNIMLVSVTERTREIGVRKALGATRNNILSQFIIESVAIASIGGVIGILFGIGAGLMILNSMSVEGGIAFSSIAVGFLFSAFVGIVSGLYPAYKAANMNPIDSLRYE